MSLLGCFDNTAHNDWADDDVRRPNSVALRRHRIRELKRLVDDTDSITVDDQGNFNVVITCRSNPVSVVVNKRGYIVGMVERIDDQLSFATAGSGCSFEVHSSILSEQLKSVNSHRQKSLQ